MISLVIQHVLVIDYAICLLYEILLVTVTVDDLIIDDAINCHIFVIRDTLNSF